MTCIVAISDGRRIWMGADSAATTAEGEVFIMAEPKVWYDLPRDMIFGVGGNLAIGQIVRYRFEPPPRPADRTAGLMAYVASDFIDALRDAFRTAGRLRTTNGFEEIDGEILVGIDGRLFTIDERFGVTEESDCYASIGTGSRAARGALYAIVRGMAPVDALVADNCVTIALDAAERFNSEVRRPFTIVHTGA